MSLEWEVVDGPSPHAPHGLTREHQEFLARLDRITAAASMASKRLPNIFEELNFEQILEFRLHAERSNTGVV